MNLAGRSAIVDGAGSGIGESVAVRFAEKGASVACVDVDGDAVASTARMIEKTGGTALAVRADVATDDGNRSMVDQTVTNFGGLDIVHLNAAVQFLALLENTPETEWDRMHATNMRGVYLGIRHALPHLRQRGGGSIIVTASVLGIVGDPDLPAYGAMKGGLRALVRAVATAHGPENIRCNAICPGDVDTPMGAEFFDHQPNPAAARKEVTDRYPLRRFATPRDIANVAVFLASDDASYLTGIDVVVDGGLLARVY
ncbi:SDR family oxidoreductase [soil metagenome]